jgi:Adenine-specific methyltransferase EcoRI
MANSNLTKAKNAKNDEFYTQYHDIEKEIMAYLEFNPDTFTGKTVLLPCDDPEWSNFTKFFAQNFERLKLKKLISTSFAPDSKSFKINYAPTLFETTAPQFDKTKTIVNGKIFTLDHDTSGDGKIDVNDLEWTYLKGDGDFKSEEIIKLRNEADIVITNPPFSHFREFLVWIIEANKKFMIIGNMNAITYKEVFPLIKENKVWIGATGSSNDMVFAVPKGTEVADKDKQKAAKLGYVGDFTRLGNSCWFTNIDHGKRHKALPLMTEKDIIKFGTKQPFQKFENYDAIEVPYVKFIPSDFTGVMGVPISFLDKYSPEQFEIVKFRHGNDDKDLRLSDGTCPYFRILIKHINLPK